ncbi:DUF423 domain-containing protein [Larsenimonas suaedae]|uniref:DUF423 domain-containing protein n=1 Tax=Larsenimonas suaedae TaxID=1851019 RepID=A0ABU1GSG2_9GAMM|nr:DUF423 domain-containing protein [Larsenimonas suaedae]MCM2972240.1 DUF423 domain-containing protein [Larsenimonas suaedae]MDR5894964.1 DUF423 domain-containing protein [Larsenimonas suaedae]
MMRGKFEQFAVYISGFVAVSAGAFGTHGLEGQISNRLLHAWETGVHYQMWHTLAIMVMLIRYRTTPTRASLAAIRCWLAGIALFSGSLYALALGAPRMIGPITPIGGALLLLGWLIMAVATLRPDRNT